MFFTQRRTFDYEAAKPNEKQCALGLDELAVEACGCNAVNVQPEISAGHPITKAHSGDHHDT